MARIAATSSSSKGSVYSTALGGWNAIQMACRSRDMTMWEVPITPTAKTPTATERTTSRVRVL